MTIEAIAALNASTAGVAGIGSATSVATNVAAESQSVGVFESILQNMENLSAQMTANHQAAQTLAVGDADNLHRVMMAMEHTKLQFELALQVRNKVLDAYQELMRMQV